MSADNGIFILVTEEKEGTKYRVAYAHAIDNIYGKFNEETGKFDGNLNNIKDLFGGPEVKVFNTLPEAYDFAETLSSSHDYLEYGVSVITDFKEYDNLFEEVGKD